MVSIYCRGEKRNKKLFQELILPKRGQILDLSCGECFLLEMIQKNYPNLELFGLDVSEEAIKLAKTKLPNANFITAKADETHLNSSEFDVVICSMSLHHYEKAGKTLLEVHRILKPTGKFYLMDVIPKNKLSQYIYNFIGCPEPYHFEKFYTLEEIGKLLSDAGLKIISTKSISLFSRKILLEVIKIP